MVKNLPPNEEPFSPEEYSGDIKNPKELLRREFDAAKEEELLLFKRISALEEKEELIGREDPEYALLQTKLEMTQIELDELHRRMEDILEKLKEL